MAVDILKSKSEISQARSELRRRGLSFIGSGWRIFLRMLRVSKTIPIGDHLKSWDVLKTADFIEKNISKDAPILDMGAYASEIVCVLHRIGYSHLTAIDLNPQIKMMPFSDAVRYEVSDFMHTPFENGSFEVITAISVIEHGYQSRPLLSEISRLLRPGGYFIASFDYWPEKVDTAGALFFGMDWKIFSKKDAQDLIDEAATYGLTPAGGVNFEAHDAPIHCAGKNYTFAWLALQKGLHRSSS